jgi:hypothetical protein
MKSDTVGAGKNGLLHRHLQQFYRIRTEDKTVKAVAKKEYPSLSKVGK